MVLYPPYFTQEYIVNNYSDFAVSLLDVKEEKHNDNPGRVLLG